MPEGNDCPGSIWTFSFGHLAFIFIINEFDFQSRVRLTENREEGTENSHLLIASRPQTHILPHYQHPPPQWHIFVPNDEPTLTHHDHSKSTVYMRVHFGILNSVCSDKCIMTQIYHCNIIQNSSTSLKILCVPFISPSTPPNPWKPLIFILPPKVFISRMSCA